MDAVSYLVYGFPHDKRCNNNDNNNDDDDDDDSINVSSNNLAEVIPTAKRGHLTF